MNKDVVSLPIAKKLKEAGWKQDSSTEFYWAWWKKKGEPKLYEWGSIKKPLTAAAPTIADLLEALPKELSLLKVDTVYTAKLPRRPYLLHADTPADALALLWMALKEKNLIPA